MQQSQSVTPVLLAGGGGSRLWPMSTHALPKQFAALTCERTLMAETLVRVHPDSADAKNFQFSDPIVVGSARHRQRLDRELNVAGANHASIILEPCARNTAPAIAAAALSLEQMGGGDQLMLVLPSDHHICDVPAFHRAIATAIDAAVMGRLVTFGIPPTHPETGYGYIKRGKAQGDAFAVEEFVEKPAHELARQYVSSGYFHWNAGIFMFRASTIIESLETLAPDVLNCAHQALSGAERKTSAILLDGAAFTRCPAISIDDAVMAKGGHISVVPVAMGWSDVGSWHAIHEIRAEDDHRNTARGRVIAQDTSNSLIHADSGIIAAIGVSDLAIVKSGDAVLVTTLANSQGVRSVGQRLDQTIEPRQTASTDLEDFTPSAARFTAWMRNHALPLWADQGWDRERGGFREFLGKDSKPCAEPFRRIRVQARQIYVLAAAHLMGWDGSALEIANQGFEYLADKGWLPDGGWAHKLDAQGHVIDETRDAYDHAFVLLALAWLHRASGSDEALIWAGRTLSWLDAVLVDTEHGGYRESIPEVLPRRTNSHMHLLEALLALYDATRDVCYLDRADRIVGLFRQRFFDRQSGTLREFFQDDWAPASGETGRTREPGHHFEWAWLLDRYEARLGSPCTEEISALTAFADRHGKSDQNRLIHDSVDDQGGILSANHRLWCQTEALRTQLMLAERGHADQASRFDELTGAVFRYHLNIEPIGLWHDRVDAGGTPIHEFAPASTLYHLMTLVWDLEALFAQSETIG